MAGWGEGKAGSGQVGGDREQSLWEAGWESLWCTRDPPTETQAQTPQPTPPRRQALGSTARPLLPVDG